MSFWDKKYIVSIALIVSALISFLLDPSLRKIYGFSQFGELAGVLSYSSVLAVLISLKYEILGFNKNKSRVVLKYFRSITLCMCGLLTIVFFILGHSFTVLFYALLVSINAFVLVYLTATSKYLVIGFLIVLRKIVEFVLPVIFSDFDILTWYIIALLPSSFYFLAPPYGLAGLKELKNLLLQIYPYTISEISNVWSQGFLLIYSMKYFSVSQVGQFDVILKYGLIPFLFLGQVWGREFAASSIDKVGIVLKSYFKTAGILSVVYSISYIGLYNLVVVKLYDDWIASIAVQIFLITYLLLFNLVAPLGNYLVNSEFQDRFNRLKLIRAFFFFLIYFIDFSVLAFSGVFVLVNIIYLSTMFFWSFKSGYR